MKTIFLLAAVAVFQFATAQKTIELEKFKSLTVGSDSKVTMVKSDTNKLVIEYEDNESDYFQSNNGSLILSGDGNFTVYYASNLENITVNPDAVLTCDDEIKSNRLVISVSEDAVVTLKGKAKNHSAILDADAELNAKNLVSHNVDISLSEDAVAIITSKKAVNATASEDATIQIYGNPSHVSKKSSSDATITVM